MSDLPYLLFGQKSAGLTRKDILRRDVMKKFCSLLLALTLVVTTLMPMTVRAAGTGKAIQLVDSANPTGGVEDQHHVYYGKDTSATNFFDGCWRVLDADKTNIGSDGMFLLTENLIGDPSSTYGGVFFNTDAAKKNDWQGSDAQTWCGTFLSDSFSSAEQDAIIATYKSDGEDSYQDPKYAGPAKFRAADSILNGDKIFFLSSEEAHDSSYGFTDGASRLENFKGSPGVWSLRSPGISLYSPYDIEAGYVDDAGEIHIHYVFDDKAARPAFNLDLSSVLFTSAAIGGKSTGAEGPDALQTVTDYSGSEWKLTLNDSAHNGFNAGSVTGNSSAVTVNYSGAVTGSNEYISALITDSTGTIKYYGRIAAASSADGSVAINLTGKLGDSDKLYIFNEQYNGDKVTDYASELKEVTVPAPVIYNVTVSTGSEGGGTASASPASGAEGTEITLKATPDAGYKFKEWQVISGGVSVADTASAETTLTIGTSDVEVKAVFEELPPAEYSVTVSTDGNGTASADPTSGTKDTTVTLKASPKSGYKFKEWQVISGGVSVADTASAETTLTIGTSDVEVKAVFEELPPAEYSVTVSTDGNGTASADPTSGTKDTTVTLKASPKSGYKFKEWQVISGGVSVADKGSAETTLTIGTTNVEVKAIFEKEESVAPAPAPEYQHEHNYVWQIAREATPTEDGEMVYICKECGSVMHRIPISGYVAFNEDTAKKIRNARQGAELVVHTEKWISFYSVVWDELEKRPDITLVINYNDKGKMYEVVVPAGTDVDTIKNEEGYAGFLFLSGKFGRREVKSW